MNTFLAALILSLLFGASAFAVDTPTVLPGGVRSLVVKRGGLTGLNQYYTGSGQLNYLSELNSIELDVKNLVQLEPQVQEFVSVLNNFGTFELGSQLHLGKLAVNADPEVSYYAPMFLYGVNKKLTLGLAIPLIQYKNDISVISKGSNLQALRDEFGGKSPQLDAAFAQLDRDMTLEFHKALSEKGYDPIENVKEDFIGDLTLIAAYQFPKEEKWTYATQVFIGLPTGPKPDADSLTDLETFGRWTVQTQFLSEYRIRSKISLLGTVSYLASLPGKIEKRVPLDENDSLPDQKQKMKLSVDSGDSVSGFLGVALQLTSNVTTASAYGIEKKTSDKYKGAPEDREKFLEQNTNREARILKFEVIYSSVQDYLVGKSALPASFGYELSQIISGVNIENQRKHEVTLSVYF